MRYGEKVRKVNVRKSRGREFVVEVPKIREPDYDHKIHEKVAAEAAGTEHVSDKYIDKNFLKKLNETDRVIAKTKEDAIAGAHILSALHLLYRIYGNKLYGNSPERIAENIGYKVDKEDEKLFKKAVGIMEWLSGKYPKEGHVILHSPEDIEKNLDEVATKIALDLHVTDPQEKELIKKYILAATKTARAIASAISKANPTSGAETRKITKRALQLEKDDLLELYNIRRKLGEKERGEDPHSWYPTEIKDDIQEIKRKELEEKRRLEEERRRREEEERKRQEEMKRKEIELEKQKAHELLEKFAAEKDDKKRQELAKQMDEIVKHPETWEELAKVKPEWVKRYIESEIRLSGEVSDTGKVLHLWKRANVPLSVIAKVKPEWVKRYIESEILFSRDVSDTGKVLHLWKRANVPLSVIAKVHPEWAKEYIEEQIKAGKDPKEFLEAEKGLLEREFMEEFLKQHGYLKEVEEKAKEIKEKAAEIEGTGENVGIERVKVDVLSTIKALEFADFSEKAIEKATNELKEKLKLVLSNGPNDDVIYSAGLYAYLLDKLEKKDTEKLEALKEFLS